MQFFNVKTVEETFELIRKNVQPLQETEKIPLEAALGRVLAANVTAGENVPGFARSTVDGYAVIARDTYGSTESMPGFLNVAGRVEMGVEAVQQLNQGEAISVPTGGMLPPGSDSVLMIEHCEEMDELLNTFRQVAPGENVISAGEDVKEGEPVLYKGTRLRPQELGALASLGISEVEVYRKVKVAYLSSGDEIVPYSTKELSSAQVRDINHITITSLVREWGYDAVYGGIVSDDYETFRSRAKELYDEADCLILSGGSSVGAKDYTTEVISSLGEPGVYVHGVSIKPGKPTILSQAGEKPVIGLPGHPASAMIIFHLFGKKVLEQLSGGNPGERPDRVLARMNKNIPSSPGRADYVRVKLGKVGGEWQAEPIIGKSGLISTLVKSDGVVEIGSEKEGVQQGELVPVIVFD